MKSKRTKAFKALYAKLPKDVQRLADAAFDMFELNPAHPGLDFKQVSPRGPTYSARVGMHWRALAVRTANHWLWYWIGPHAEYDKLV